ncbi:conserved oligomeric Golgi complex subunit 1-like [Ornithodoros turicata]|uniref:conserved oligomeric Golgi complex subunit 1-like n=1 Tax=Ornithodoros turicata TaxID=34597 RepID=UPI00313917A2
MKLVQGGIDMLFEQYSVKEIQEIEQTIRGDIERKKEELRQMVGERYRDLIEAADTISKMKETSESVKKYISSLTIHCGNLQQAGQSSSSKLSAATGESTTASCYAILAQVKLLVDAPSKLWSLLEEKQYMACGALFLLAQQTHTHVQLAHVGRVRRLLDPWRTLVARQWASLSCFRQTMLQTCWKALQSLDVTSELALQSLCCIVLLEDSAVQDVFEQFLNKRLDLVKDIFSSGKRGSVTTREQMSHLASLVISTFRLLHSIFLCRSDGHPSLVESELKKATDPHSPDLVHLIDSPGSVSSSYIPQVIREYRIKLRTVPRSVEAPKIQQELRTFVEKLETQSQPYVASQLKYLQSSKAVIQVGLAVQELLSEQDKEFPPWDDICIDLLGEKFSVWATIFQGKCMERIKVIVSLQMDNAMDSCIELLTNTKKKARENGMSPLEQSADVSTWTETVGDWSSSKIFSSHHGKKSWECGTLATKARGHTAQIQGICNMLDKNLKNIHQDLEALTPESSTAEERQIISSHVHTSTTVIIKRFLDFVQKELQSTEPDKDWFALLGKVCFGLSDLSPHLQQCFSVSSKRNVSAKVPQDVHPWQHEKNLLLQHRDLAFKCSLSVITDTELKAFKENMMSGSVDTILQTILQWSEVEIQEETEGGGKVKSTIHLPHQISVSLQELLFGICQEINRVFGHSLSREALMDANLRILDGVQPIYRESAKAVSQSQPTPLCQTWALQILLDIRVLAELLRPGTSRSDDTLNALRSQLESYIDPFDLDVFTPHLVRHVEHVTYQSSLLLGLTLSPNRLHYDRPQQPPATVVHNILPLHANATRFSLLPITSRFLDRAEPPTLHAPVEAPGKLLPAEYDMPKETPSLTMSRSTPVFSSSSSFYEKMATTMRSSWFGGQ